MELGSNSRTIVQHWVYVYTGYENDNQKHNTATIADDDNSITTTSTNDHSTFTTRNLAVVFTYFEGTPFEEQVQFIRMTDI
mmetsp:Transcript_10117/g.11227  ORF Transcript_10117/g.11227 Transcript_10117/m.11227 type:complete len:81 (+) Transcript_10117:113-355(+)